MKRLTEHDFERAYERLSQRGTCDSPGGMEYTRVLQEWKAAGCPAGLDHFIAVRANMIPGIPGRETLN